MNIMHKRPLCLILCIALSGFVLFSYLEYGIWKVTFAALAGISLLTFAIILLIKKKGRFSLVCSLILCLSLLFSYLYFDLWFQADKRFPDKCTVEGVIISESPFESYSVFEIKTDSINSEALSQYKLSAVIGDSEIKKNDLKIGVRVRITGELESATQYATYPFRNISSHGINAHLEGASDILVLGKGDIPLSSRLGDIREFLTRHSKMLTNEECGAFLSALIFGERDALVGDLALDFSRIGISHVLALSGMHLAVLAVGINYLLSFFRVKKKWRVGAVILFTSVYTVFTGLSVTVLRAAIMLIISSLLYLFGSEHDSVTSLSVAVAVIILFTPYSVFSISLWLSAFATLGVITAADWLSALERPKKPFAKLWRGIIKLFVPSVFAISATILISSVAFGGVSTVSLITTVIFSFLTELIMYLGTLTLIFGRIIPFSRLLIPLTEFTLDLADKIADGKYVYASADLLPYILSLIFLTLLFYIFLFIKTDRQNIFVALISALLVICFITAGLSFIDIEDKTVYSSTEKSDLFLLKSDGESSLIVNSGHARSSGRLSYYALREDNTVSLDRLVYTSYSNGLPRETEEIISKIFTYEILLPEPKSSDERDIYYSMRDIADTYGLTLSLYGVGESLQLGAHEFCAIVSSELGEPTAHAQIISYGERSLLYLSDGFTSDSLAEEYSGFYSIADSFVIGGHGTGYKNPKYIESKADGAKEIVISADNLYFTQDSLRFYEENGCRITLHPQYIALLE